MSHSSAASTVCLRLTDTPTASCAFVPTSAATPALLTLSARFSSFPGSTVSTEKHTRGRHLLLRPSVDRGSTAADPRIRPSYQPHRSGVTSHFLIPQQLFRFIRGLPPGERERNARRDRLPEDARRQPPPLPASRRTTTVLVRRDEPSSYAATAPGSICSASCWGGSKLLLPRSLRRQRPELGLNYGVFHADS